MVSHGSWEGETAYGNLLICGIFSSSKAVTFFFFLKARVFVVVVVVVFKFYSYFIYLFIYFWLCWVFGSCEGFL